MSIMSVFVQIRSYNACPPCMCAYLQTRTHTQDAVAWSAHMIAVVFDMERSRCGRCRVLERETEREREREREHIALAKERERERV